MAGGTLNGGAGDTARNAALAQALEDVQAKLGGAEDRAAAAEGAVLEAKQEAASAKRDIVMLTARVEEAAPRLAAQAREGHYGEPRLMSSSLHTAS